MSERVSNARVGAGSREAIDSLDARLLRELTTDPRMGVLEMSRRLGVARATAQARLDRLVARGVIASFAPQIDPEALGYHVTAFATLEIRQGNGASVLRHLDTIPEVLEVHTITGQGDMLCRLVARSNPDLQRVIDRVNADADIVRTSTSDRYGQPGAAPGDATHPASGGRLKPVGPAFGPQPVNGRADNNVTCIFLPVGVS